MVSLSYGTRLTVRKDFCSIVVCIWASDLDKIFTQRRQIGSSGKGFNLSWEDGGDWMTHYCKRGYFFPIIKGHLDNHFREGHRRPPKSGMMKFTPPLWLQNPSVISKTHIVAGRYSSPSLSIVTPPHPKGSQTIYVYIYTRIHRVSLHFRSLLCKVLIPFRWKMRKIWKRQIT